MNLLCVTVRDRSAEFYFPPFYVRSRVEATRVFEKLMRDPNRAGSVSEYDLFHLSDFDDQTGLSVQMEPFGHLANGVDVVPSGG